MRLMKELKKIFYILDSVYLRGRNKHVLDELSLDKNLEINGWTNGDEDVDYCIKNFQRKATSFRDVIEWISFNSLKNIKKVGKGDGAPEIQGSMITGYKRTRNKSCIIALKSSNILISLQEFKNHMECKLKGIGLKMYGLTRNTEINEYYMNAYISCDLAKIHNANYIHRDLHSGNILLNKNLDDEIYSYITDLGLSRKTDWKDLENSDLFGVLPYIAPEVLKTNQCTQAAVIYGF
ncbi:hypothetical protein C2G38_2214218 [Gigaspora rosea]|uniref:Protein kinase domain-containing protein n=1 Tax=Gigaspora rosea TaxID=44941 RepID=A0A397UFF2_9GLOM|nr:hypothetical protein C2G38_2214218 [Gigaspora rosea]